MADSKTDSNTLIEVHSQQDGTLYFRRLSRKDMRFLIDLQALTLSQRDLAAQVLHHQLKHPSLPLETIQSWSDDTLAEVSTVWASEQASNIEGFRIESTTLEEFSRAYSAIIDDHNRWRKEFLQNLGASHPTLCSITSPPFDVSRLIASSGLGAANEALDRSLKEVTKSIGKSVEEVTKSVGTSVKKVISQITTPFTLPFDIGKLFPILPSLSQLAATFQELERIEAALDEIDYWFPLQMLGLREAFDLYRSSRGHPQARSAAITNKLLAFTRSKDFEEELRAAFETATVIKPRWRIVKRALDAHRQRDYVLSVPPLLAQIEGVFAALLIIRSSVIPKGKKLFAANPDGTLKLGRDGKPIKIDGLGQLVQNSNLKNDENLNKLADYLTDQLVPDRNVILHGRRVNYDKPKLSLQALLVLYVLSAELSFLEFQQNNN